MDMDGIQIKLFVNFGNARPSPFPYRTSFAEIKVRRACAHSTQHCTDQDERFLLQALRNAAGGYVV